MTQLQAQQPQTLAEAKDLAYSTVPGAALNRSLRDAGVVGRAKVISDIAAQVGRARSLRARVNQAAARPGLSLAYDTRLRLMSAQTTRIISEYDQLAAKVVAINTLESAPTAVDPAAPKVGFVFPVWPAVVVVIVLGGWVVHKVATAEEASAQLKFKFSAGELVIAKYLACAEAGLDPKTCEPILKTLPELLKEPGLPWGLILLGAAGAGGWWWWKYKYKGARA